MKWSELESLASPAYLCDTPKAFIDAIQKAVDTKDTDTIKKFAQNASWNKRLEEIFTLMNRKIS